jgi:hypothetical protein
MSMSNAVPYAHAAARASNLASEGSHPTWLNMLVTDDRSFWPGFIRYSIIKRHYLSRGGPPLGGMDEAPIVELKMRGEALQTSDLFSNRLVPSGHVKWPPFMAQKVNGREGRGYPNYDPDTPVDTRPPLFMMSRRRLVDR